MFFTVVDSLALVSLSCHGHTLPHGGIGEQEGGCVKRWFDTSERYTVSHASVPSAAVVCTWPLGKPRTFHLLCPGAVEEVGRGKVEGPFVGVSPFCEHLGFPRLVRWFVLLSVGYSRQVLGIGDRQSQVQILAALPTNSGSN